VWRSYNLNKSGEKFTSARHAHCSIYRHSIPISTSTSISTSIPSTFTAFRTRMDISWLTTFPFPPPPPPSPRSPCPSLRYGLWLHRHLHLHLHHLYLDHVLWSSLGCTVHPACTLPAAVPAAVPATAAASASQPRRPPARSSGSSPLPKGAVHRQRAATRHARPPW